MLLVAAIITGRPIITVLVIIVLVLLALYLARRI